MENTELSLHEFNAQFRAFRRRTLTNSDLTRAIQRQRIELCSIIDLNFGLLSLLRSMAVLTDQQIDMVEGKPTCVTQVDQLLGIIVCLTFKRQKLFVAALRKTQAHVVNFIISNGNRLSSDDTTADEWPLAVSSESNLVRRNYHELIENMDPMNGLLDELLSRGCINIRHKEFIEARDTRVKKNESLLNILLKRSVSDFKKFIHCLEKTKQHQVISMLISDVASTDLPLGDEHKKRLLANYSALLSLIDTRHGLLAELLSADCITWRHKESIEIAASQSESNKRLLEIVMRGSQSGFEKFLEGLMRSGQQQVCRILQEDAIVVRIAAKLSKGNQSNERTLLYRRIKKTIPQTTAVDVNEIEEQFVEKFKQLLLQSSTERRKQLKHELLDFLINLDEGVQLIDVKKGSVVLYYLCTSLAGVKQLYWLHSSGRLQLIFSQVFTLLAREIRSVNVYCFDWSMTDYLNGIKYMCRTVKTSAFANVITTADETQRIDANCLVILSHFDKLPLELVEKVLTKSLGKLYTILNKMTSHAESYTLATLCAVASQWRQTLTQRKYTKRLTLRHFKRLCRPFKRRPQQVRELQCEANVCGLAEFSGKLYVACYKSSTVQVFDSSPPFSQLTGIEIQELKNPKDTVVCVDTSRLYIADCEQRAIWRVNLLSDKKVDEFISTQWRPWSLSTKSRRLLITPRDGNALFIFGDDGALLTKIKLPDYILAQHAIESTSKRLTYLVTHRSRWTDNMRSEHFGVSEIDNTGRVVRTFTSQHDDIGSIHVDEPHYLTLTRNNHVIVADVGDEHGPIFLLAEDLQLKRVLRLSSGGQPTRMCFSQRTELLYIACCRSSKVTVHSIIE